MSAVFHRMLPSISLDTHLFQRTSFAFGQTSGCTSQKCSCLVRVWFVLLRHADASWPPRLRTSLESNVVINYYSNPRTYFISSLLHFTRFTADALHASFATRYYRSTRHAHPQAHLFTL
jgi:hypothetical protein